MLRYWRLLSGNQNIITSLSEQQTKIRNDLGLVKEYIKSISSGQIKVSTVSEIQRALVDLTKNDETRADTLKNVQQEVSDAKVEHQDGIKNLNDTIVAKRNVHAIILLHALRHKT